MSINKLILNSKEYSNNPREVRKGRIGKLRREGEWG